MIDWNKEELNGAYDDMLYIRQCVSSNKPLVLAPKLKLWNSALLAGELINKRTPRKPVERSCGRVYCPDCGRQLKRFSHQFCPKCGQYIDWEENKE